MTGQRAKYDAAFKLEIAKMVVDHGLTVSQVVKDMNIGETAVRRWVAQYQAERQGQSGIGCKTVRHVKTPGMLMS